MARAVRPCHPAWIRATVCDVSPPEEPDASWDSMSRQLWIGAAVAVVRSTVPSRAEDDEWVEVKSGTSRSGTRRNHGFYTQPRVLHTDRSEYALTVNVSGLLPVEQISHPKSTCPTNACGDKILC